MFLSPQSPNPIYAQSAFASLLKAPWVLSMLCLRSAVTPFTQNAWRHTEGIVPIVPCAVLLCWTSLCTPELVIAFVVLFEITMVVSRNKHQKKRDGELRLHLLCALRKRHVISQLRNCNTIPVGCLVSVNASKHVGENCTAHEFFGESHTREYFVTTP